jgi:hypothetical protein
MRLKWSLLPEITSVIVPIGIDLCGCLQCLSPEDARGAKAALGELVPAHWKPIA